MRLYYVLCSLILPTNGKRLYFNSIFCTFNHFISTEPSRSYGEANGIYLLPRIDRLHTGINKNKMYLQSELEARTVLKRDFGNMYGDSLMHKVEFVSAFILLNFLSKLSKLSRCTQFILTKMREMLVLKSKSFSLLFHDWVTLVHLALL